MKGSTHLAIGCAIGAAAAGYHSFDPKSSLIFIAVAAISSLSPDLDGPSLLSSKISKVSKTLYRACVMLAVVMSLLTIYLYIKDQHLHLEWIAISLCTLLPALILNQGLIRNSLVGIVGAVIGLAGYFTGMPWLAGLGIFMIIAPWLKHRGLTHTIWALAAWLWIGQGLEDQLGIKDLAMTACAGYASHLIADTLTVSGVKWLYPLTKVTFKLPFR